MNNQPAILNWIAGIVGKKQKHKMEKLQLTEEQRAIFKMALNEAYDKGSQDATFLANSMYQLVETAGKCIPKIIEKFSN